MPDGERWVRGATTPVAACVRSALEREPAVRGELTLHVELAGRPAVTPTSGDLSSIAMSRCVAEALAARPVPPGATGSLDYTLTLSGHYDAAPLREDAVLKARWVGFDWTGAIGGAMGGLLVGWLGLRRAQRQSQHDPRLQISIRS